MVIQKFSPILAIVPLALIIITGFYFEIFNPKTKFYKFLDLIAEKDMDKWMLRAGIDRTVRVGFQILRLGGGAVLGAVIAYVYLGEINAQFILFAILFSIIVYKVIYLYLIAAANSRISRLNKLLPYFIKTIAYLAYVYPINNAIITSLDYVPKEFENDMKLLIEDMDKYPNSFDPFQNFIDRYDGQLDNLDAYFRSIYRMSMSAKDEDKKTLNSLNETISQDVNRVREAKNKAINTTVSTVGMIPVALLSIMLTYVLVSLSGF